MKQSLSNCRWPGPAGTGSPGQLSGLAKGYIALVAVLGAALLAFVPGELRLPSDRRGLITLVFAVIIAAVCQLQKAEGKTARTSYDLGLAAFSFALLALGLGSAIFVALFACLVDWIWHRYPWHIQTFNTFSLIVGLSAAAATYGAILGESEQASAQGALALAAATACFVVLNHLMVGLAVSLGKKEPLAKSGVFARSGLLIDAGLFITGAAAALLWLTSPHASLVMLVPLYAFWLVLKIPSLEGQATTDVKTGLYNARYFQEALNKELSRANRTARPVTVIIGDLDLLRNINNTYGHLAGDQVLYGVAQMLKEEFRDYDVVARVGGEEFCVLLPETRAADAARRVERLRQKIQAARFPVDTSPDPIRVSMSFGIAERLRPGEDAKSLLHRADLALYKAKLAGRNRIRIASQDKSDRRSIARAPYAADTDPATERFSPREWPESVQSSPRRTKLRAAGR
ncbi:MAG: GGDEF domain-containing protein [Thermoleophilia bacterium]|nr:GGDEF domain-containing protein [Thermoleophilia bacterium]